MMIVIGAVTIFALLHMEMPLTALGVLLSPFTGVYSIISIMLGVIIDLQD